MTTTLSDLTLVRVPAQPKQPLRAWDAADDLVVQHLADEPPASTDRVVVINDAFGALACGLRDLDPTIINESAAGRIAVFDNLTANELAPLSVHSMLELETIAEALGGPIDVVVIKVPKSNAQLIDLLHRLRPHLHAGSRIVGAGMVKHIRTSTLECFTSIIGPTRTSLATRKARLIHTTLDEALTPGSNPWPATWTASGLKLTNHGGGFSASGLDSGTGFLLSTVESFADYLNDAGVPGAYSADAPARVVDLGCGNGIIGLRIARDLAESEFSFTINAVDDSALALDAAKNSWAESSPEQVDQVTFEHQHRLIKSVGKASADLIVVNPPFHDDRVIGDHTAWSMFTDSHNALQKGGSLVVVGNRHLAYHAKLKKIFGQVETIGANKKFVVLRSRK